MTVEIPLSRGLVVLVDDEDAGMVGQYRWFPLEGGRKGTGLWYAYRALRKADGRGRGARLMHQQLTGWPLTDHVNGNGLDNRRANLRPASREQNQYNARKRSGATSRFKGVFWKQRRGRWEAQIYIREFGADGTARKRRLYLGRFTSETAAAHAYDEAARAHFGAFAALNFPAGHERAALVEGSGS